MNTIDINSDLGESFGQWHMGDDARMLTVVSSANIACGFHAGDPAGMRATLSRRSQPGVLWRSCGLPGYTGLWPPGNEYGR
jgi:lactam utilization protein B